MRRLAGSAAFVIAVGVMMTTASAALAQADSKTEIPLGLWQAAPQADGTVFHVRTKRCGRALCGRVERVKNRRGYDTPSNAVSSVVMRDLKPQPDGSFAGEMRGGGGAIFPQSRVQLRGNALEVRLCDGSGCRDQVWKRLR